MEIDFETMRENCIQTHQVVHELFTVAMHVGVDLNLKVKSANELRKHEETQSWDGMGRFSKELYDNTEMWDKLPDQLWIRLHEQRVHWVKNEARRLLLDSFYSLGGNNLYQAVTT